MAKITIIGGGITGLTTAIALEKLGINYCIYEKAPELKEIGAGIWLQPNALKVFDFLGIKEQIKNNGFILNNAEITNRNLKTFSQIDLAALSKKEVYKIVSIHRARLQKVLFDAIPSHKIVLGKEYLSHKIQGEKIKIQFADEEIETDILLGADGIHSKVREQLFPQSSLRYSGQTCWRGISQMKLPEIYQSIGREAWGKNIRFGFASISSDEIYWFAVSKAPQNEKDNPLERKPNLLELYKNFHPLVSEIIEHTPPNKIIRNDILDLNRLNTWYQKNICLLGDAAHATTPNMGQGAGQGIEDAYYLSHFISQEKNIEQAFHLFEKERRKKVDRIVKTSWMIGKIAHSSLGQKIMQLSLKLTPKKIMLGQMVEMYHIKEY